MATDRTTATKNLINSNIADAKNITIHSIISTKRLLNRAKLEAAKASPKIHACIVSQNVEFAKITPNNFLRCTGNFSMLADVKNKFVKLEQTVARMVSSCLHLYPLRQEINNLRLCFGEKIGDVKLQLALLEKELEDSVKSLVNLSTNCIVEESGTVHEKIGSVLGAGSQSLDRDEIIKEYQPILTEHSINLTNEYMLAIVEVKFVIDQLQNDTIGIVTLLNSQITALQTTISDAEEQAAEKPDALACLQVQETAAAKLSTTIINQTCWNDNAFIPLDSAEEYYLMLSQVPNATITSCGNLDPLPSQDELFLSCISDKVLDLNTQLAYLKSNFASASTSVMQTFLQCLADQSAAIAQQINAISFQGSQSADRDEIIKEFEPIILEHTANLTAEYNQAVNQSNFVTEQLQNDLISVVNLMDSQITALQNTISTAEKQAANKSEVLACLKVQKAAAANLTTSVINQTCWNDDIFSSLTVAKQYYLILSQVPNITIDSCGKLDPLPNQDPLFLSCIADKMSDLTNQITYLDSNFGEATANVQQTLLQCLADQSANMAQIINNISLQWTM
ncbi:uncharacterized protein BDFB_008840 [Asbolus verrucosus]|uniref:Uncharacterized protein n=1 Tax=Asbolus verrucosus TaxID=1661398 RepID=A0A482VB09_ASBVE|nr:uncharacterized protein BDFB_008840 [Asbolus verrucosus]